MLPITPAISIQQSITEQLNKKCNQNAILKGKSLKTLENKGFEALLQLFELANKILLLYFLVLVLWFYLVLYVFNCPKSIGCTERCYQIVIMIVLSIIFSLKRLKQLLAIHLTLQQSVLE